ncbi:hypothetical protein P3S68_032913 [Capsicum galapagoense]
MIEMVHDAFGMQHGGDFRKNIEDVPNREAGRFYEQLHAASHPLFDGYSHLVCLFLLAKKMGRKVRQDEVFEKTHVRKKKNSTDEDVWVESRAKATHDKYMQLGNEYRSTQPPESPGDTIPEDVEELWKETVGPPVRGQYYGYHRKCFSENVRSSSGPTFYLSSVYRETVESLKNTIFKLTEELAAYRKRGFPPCLGDAAWAAKGLGPLDNISTDEESDLVCAAEDADDKEDDEW